MNSTALPSFIRARVVFVGAEGVRTDRTLKAWVDRGATYASSLPAKTLKWSAARRKP